MALSETRDTIMDAARAMVQAHGYNALSFREVGKVVGVKSASIHYHFPTKGDLGAALAKAYTERGRAFLGELAAVPDLGARMDRYVAIFRSALEDDNRMCLCGIMAAEYGDLPPQVRDEVDGFTEMNITWLAQQLADAAPDVDMKEHRRRATAIFSAIEGAQLVARGRADLAMYDDSIAALRSYGLLP